MNRARFRAELVRRIKVAEREAAALRRKINQLHEAYAIAATLLEIEERRFAAEVSS